MFPGILKEEAAMPSERDTSSKLHWAETAFTGRARLGSPTTCRNEGLRETGTEGCGKPSGQGGPTRNSEARLSNCKFPSANVQNIKPIFTYVDKLRSCIT